jgi:N-acetylglucosaminyldiphosphoundecaprenol N-acetyl-beta-D-mannosaminyltransferase
MSTLEQIWDVGRTPSRPVPHTEFLGLPFCQLPQAEVVRLIIIIGGGAPYRYAVTPNAHHVVTVHDKPERLLPVYRGAWLSLCDSRVLRALARLDGLALSLVTGSDLVAALCSALDSAGPARTPRRLLIVGPSGDAEGALRASYPNLTFDVLPAPNGLAHSADRRRAVARRCVDRSWDILLLCVGSPAQELIACEIGKLGRNSGLALCVGASIDFLSGKSVRAPVLVQKLHLEWAYRLFQEPARLWRRYLVESPRIFGIFMTARSTRDRQNRCPRTTNTRSP